jgi:hypothetical protein
VEFISLPDLLFDVALALLIAISGGVIYLTAIEWRDRRRQDQEKKARR